MEYKLMKTHMQPQEHDEEWLNPRLTYLRKISKPLPSTCPECGGELEHTPHDETICTSCNLIIREPIHYVGLKKIIYPYGVLDFNRTAIK